ncbi:MAG: hypothetical protein EOP07_25340, partial [Proteobacteria bacterium]
MWLQSLALAASLTAASGPQAKDLELALQQLSLESKSRVGICIKRMDAEAVCANRDDKFPLQSVMKMVVGAAVLDLVDQKKYKLSSRIEVTPADASPGPQEFADLVVKK